MLQQRSIFSSVHQLADIFMQKLKYYRNYIYFRISLRNARLKYEGVLVAHLFHPVYADTILLNEMVYEYAHKS